MDIRGRTLWKVLITQDASYERAMQSRNCVLRNGGFRNFLLDMRGRNKMSNDDSCHALAIRNPNVVSQICYG